MPSRVDLNGGGFMAGPLSEIKTESVVLSDVSLGPIFHVEHDKLLSFST